MDLAFVLRKYKIFYNIIAMEKNLHDRYATSQDHLIISLNDQIEALVPLKDSYASLQRYHIKLTNDFESLLSEQVSHVLAAGS